MNMNKKAPLLKHLGVAVAAAIFATSGGAEVAAAEPAQDDLIEEIIVTANKRSQSVQEVASSLSVLGAGDLDARGIKDMYDIQFAVPSLHFGPQLGSQKITIRGISEFNRQPGVAVSLDGIYQSRSSTAHLYQLDIERLEVLRGPQGTLYGRNSNGGAVNFISAAPTREAEGMLRVGYAEHDETKIQAVYSGPISDRVAFRIAVDHLDSGAGWVNNLVPGEKDLMRGESSNIRLKLAAEPTDTVSVDLMYVKTKVTGPQEHLTWVTFNPDTATAGGTPQLVTAGKTFEPFNTHVNGKNDSDREFELVGLTLEWDMGWATLRSITAQQEFDDLVEADRDLTDAPLFDIVDMNTIDAFTQEINILGSNDRLDWVVGAFYLREKWNRGFVFSNAEPVFFIPFPSQFINTQPKLDTDSMSWFFDATWEVTDRARVSAGVRRTEDEIDEYHLNQGFGLIPDPILLFVGCDKAEQVDWGATTIRVVGQYDVNDNGNVYASYTEGYKAGGIAAGECRPPYNPETVDAYELGYKATFGGSTTLSAAAFHYDYSDFQVAQIIGITSVTRNAGDAEVLGFELELSSTLDDNWMVSGAVTLLDTEYGDFLNLDGLQAALGFQNNKGNPLNHAPDTSVNLGVTYNAPAVWGGHLTLRIDAAYRSRTYFREFKNELDSQSAYTVINVNANWESDDGKWGARLFARNATDEDYLLYLLGSSGVGARYGSYGPARQVGMEVTRRFGAH